MSAQADETAGDEWQPEEWQGEYRQGEDGLDQPRRSIWARLGVCLLNIITPGLGLLRLGKAKAALGFFAVQWMVTPLVILVYALLPHLTLPVFRWIIGSAFVAAILLYLGSIMLSWRGSVAPPPEPAIRPWWSRWYGLILATLLLWTAMYPLTDWREGYYRNFYIPAESMEPGLMVGDRFIADMRGHAPIKRGDIVIVKTHIGEDYIKRVVALPGDRIEGRQGQIILNGTPVSQTAMSSSGPQMYQEQLPGEATPHVILDHGPSTVDDWPQMVLGADQYFLMGDNRDRSADSRVPPDFMGLGIVTKDRITGKFAFIWWHRHEGSADHGAGVR